MALLPKTLWPEERQCKYTEVLLTDCAVLETRANKAGYECPKYVTFMRTLLTKGYDIYIYPSKTTTSKYIAVSKGNRRFFRVRFSNHQPSKHHMRTQPCDFYVGKTSRGTTTTSDALRAVEKFFQTT